MNDVRNAAGMFHQPRQLHSQMGNKPSQVLNGLACVATLEARIGTMKFRICLFDQWNPDCFICASLREEQTLRAFSGRFVVALATVVI